MIKVPKRKKSSHKGDNGRVLIIGGSKDYAGAVMLATLSLTALRGGTDLVTVAAPEKVAWTINKILPDIVTKKMKGEYFSEQNCEMIEKNLDRYDVMLIGPGISETEKTRRFITRLSKNKQFNEMTKVIDADAIKLISLKDVDNAIFTPHHKEFEILLKNSELTERNIKANLKNNVILLKGKQDKIISKTKTETNKTGNEGMTVGGTGDVLAGLCAGLASQGLSLFDAAHTSAYILGTIGDKLGKKLGNGFIASDFLSEIPVQIKKLYK